MSYKDLHPEDVKAAIRKRFGSLKNFEFVHGLAQQGVADLLRGRTSARTASVVDAVLTIENASVVSVKSKKKDYSQKKAPSHRLNDKAA